MLPGILAQKAFLLFLLLFFVDLVFGVFIFYRYNFPSQDLILGDQVLKIEKKTLQPCLDSIEKDRERFEETKTKIYPNILGAPIAEYKEEAGEGLTEE